MRHSLPLCSIPAKFFLNRLFFLCSSVVLLNQNLAAQAQITPNGAGTLVNSQGNQINITGGTQAGANLFHSFRDFNLTPAQVANFLSNPQTQNILARINGGNPSLINGLLQVTGGNSNLFLMNPAGIVFGQGASLNVPASFTATTANQIGLGNNQYFSAIGNNNYAALTGNPDSFLFTTTQAGSIVNAGNLAVGSGQNLSLIAGNTINTGRLSAPGGEIQVLAVPGTNRVRLSQPGQVLSLEIVPPVDGILRAVDLPALLTGSDLPGIVVNPSGQVTVAGTSLPNQQGVAVASGSIDVSSSTGMGGTVQVMGDRVAALNSRINANGATGGGTVRLGGEYLGGRDTGIAPALRFNSQRTLVDRDSLIRANATVTGEGGRVIIWADQNTGYFGRITGRGATGRGGFVEVSGKENLAFDGRVELQGFNGLGGTLLLDPANITIVAGAIGTGSGDGSLPSFLATAFPLPDPMTITDSALAAISAGTAININALNTIDFQTTVNLIANGTAPITFTAPTITASAGLVTLNARGRNVVLNGTNNINAPSLSITSTRVGANSGNIQATASTGNLILRDLDVSSNSGNGGNVTLNAPQGIVTTGNIFSYTNGTNSNGGNVTLNASQGSITTGTIFTHNNNTGNGGVVNLSAQGDIANNGNLYTYAVTGNGGNINVISNQGNAVTTGTIITNTTTGNSGIVNFTAQGNITTAAINTYVSIGNSGGANLTAQGNILTGGIYSPSANLGNGGATNLTAQGNITTGFIDSSGSGAGNASGVININAGSLFRATVNGNGICAGVSVCSARRNGANTGAITIRHGGSTTTPFIVGNSATNGTTGIIDAGTGNIINTTFSVPVPPSTYTQGIVQIITTVPVVPPVVPPVVTPAASPTISPELLTLLQNPAAPATPAPVVVGTPPVDTVVELPISITPPVVSPVIPTPQPSPLVITNPIPLPTPIPSPVVVATPIPISTPSASPNLPSEMRTALANLDPQEIRQAPEPPAGTLAFITNPSNAEIAARLRTLGTAQNDIPAIQANLNQTATNTGKKPAQIYVFFTPQNLASRNEDTLEIILITGRGEPRRLQLSGITRSQVLGVVANLRSANESVNLNGANQLYQWILAPLESELQQQGIDNLIFVLDPELRSLPLESLYDGQRFLRERYTISKP